jgi:hypothetical protein
MARRQVELPVCEVCGHIGKLPVGLFSGKGFCSGPKDAQHKRVPMKPRVFRELVVDEEADADHRQPEAKA